MSGKEIGSAWKPPTL